MLFPYKTRKGSSIETEKDKTNLLKLLEQTLWSFFDYIMPFLRQYCLDQVQRVFQ